MYSCAFKGSFLGSPKVKSFYVGPEGIEVERAMRASKIHQSDSGVWRCQESGSAVKDGYGKAGAVSGRHDEAAQPFSMCTCQAAEHGNPSWAERTELDCDLGSDWCVCV